MKITYLINKQGDMCIILPKRTESTQNEFGTVSETHRMGIIHKTDDDYYVEFVLDALKEYNKGGFTDRLDAIAYEQGILSANTDLVLAYLT